MTACQPATPVPALEIQLSPTGYTTYTISPSRTLIKLRESDAHHRAELIAAIMIIRQRIGAVDRTWKGNPYCNRSGVAVLLNNRTLTRERSFAISAREIDRHRHAHAGVQAQAAA